MTVKLTVDAPGVRPASRDEWTKDELITLANNMILRMVEYGGMPDPGDVAVCEIDEEGADCGWFTLDDALRMAQEHGPANLVENMKAPLEPGQTQAVVVCGERVLRIVFRLMNRKDLS